MATEWADGSDLVEFESHGSKIRAFLFLPGQKAAQGVVVLGHGTGGTVGCGIGAVANDCCHAGWAALAIDYRGYGESEDIVGQPEGLFHVERVAEATTIVQCVHIPTSSNE